MTRSTIQSLQDIVGVQIGCARHEDRKTGVTAVLFDQPATASVAVLGGAPATHETDLLRPEKTVEKVDALVLSGGSAFGLAAASGVAQALAAQGRGFQIGPSSVPIVPCAAIFDLNSSADGPHGPPYPYFELGQQAVDAAARDIPMGSVGAGVGAQTATVKGGQGAAAARFSCGAQMIAVMIVNAVGSALFGDGPHFLASPFEVGDEFGGLGLPQKAALSAQAPPFKQALDADHSPDRPQQRQNTTIGVVVTDLNLTKAQCAQLAVAAHDGLARALWPAHTPLDGDLVFAAATAAKPLKSPQYDFAEACALASSVVARAIARGVYEAAAEPDDLQMSWRTRFA